MKWLTILGVPIVLGACASEPVNSVPSNQEVADFVTTSQLNNVDIIRKSNKDSWKYVNDRYVIYMGNSDYLVEFRKNCRELTNNAWVPADYIYDHRNMRAGVDTIRGCIVEKVYPLTNSQRTELRHLSEPFGRLN